MSIYQTDLISALTTFNPHLKIYLEIEKQLESRLETFQREWQFSFIQLSVLAISKDPEIKPQLDVLRSQVKFLRKSGEKNYEVFKDAVAMTLKMVDQELCSETLEAISDIVDHLNQSMAERTMEGFNHALRMAEKLRELLTK